MKHLTRKNQEMNHLSITSNRIVLNRPIDDDDIMMKTNSFEPKNFNGGGNY